MTDANGTIVQYGDCVMVLSGANRGKCGTVRTLGTYPGRPKTLAIRADDATGDVLMMDNHTWSSWLLSKNFVVVKVPMALLPTPGTEGKTTP